MEIVKYPHPALRYICKPVKTVDTELTEIIKEMTQVDGIGLAANQVGLPYRIFVLNTRETPVVFINPVTLNRKGKLEDIPEGCLSIPGFQVKIKRSSQIKIEAYNLKGHLFEDTYKGLEAVCIQHELDHLAGKLITDYAKGDDKLIASGVLGKLTTAYELDNDEELEKLKALEALRCIDNACSQV